MKLRIKRHTTDSSVGKSSRKEKQKCSYILYDSCVKCPLWVYVELVCNDNLKALIVEGIPSDEILQATKFSLMVEFSEISGNTQTSAVNQSIKKMYVYRMQIYCIQICAELIRLDMQDKAANYLKSVGVSGLGKDKEKSLKRLEGVLKNKIINSNKEFKRYEELTKNSDEKPNPSFYSEQLAILSTFFKFNIDMNISLAQYASYLKIFNQTKSKEQWKQMN